MCDITATHSWFIQKTNMKFLFNVKQIRILNIHVCVCIVRCWIWNSQPVCCWLCPWLQWILPWPECKSDTPAKPVTFQRAERKGWKRQEGRVNIVNPRRHFFCLKPKLTQQVCSPPEEILHVGKVAQSRWFLSVFTRRSVSPRTGVTEWYR